MAKFNQHGQWSLTGNEEHLMFKTAEQKSSGKGELIERKKVDPNSEEAKAIFQKLAKAILAGVPKQPTNEQLFGHLVPAEEQVRKAEQEWENRFQSHFDLLKKPIEDQDSEDNREWGSGKSFNSTLTKEELEKRNKHID